MTPSSTAANLSSSNNELTPHHCPPDYCHFLIFSLNVGIAHVINCIIIIIIIIVNVILHHNVAQCRKLLEMVNRLD